MVALSKLLNQGLLLSSQLVFTSVATPEQASVEPYNVVGFLGGAGPYIQFPGYGISTDIPQQCTLEQVHLLSRHGERFPSKGKGKQFEKLMSKIQQFQGRFTGDLAFFNDYEYFVPNKDLYEKETSPANSEGTFSGTTDATRHGIAFRAKYKSLFDAKSETLKVFTSNSGRCHETSKYFARGFMGDQYSSSSVEYNVIDEDAKMGANSLTPRSACKTWTDSGSDQKVANYNTDFLECARERILQGNENFNLTKSDVATLFPWCAYEMNVRGSSSVCNLFTNEEFIRYSYSVDLDTYYSNSFGNNMTAVIGAPYLNATLKFLQEPSPAFKILLAFTHDTDLEIFHSALGLFQTAADLPTDHVPFPSPYPHGRITPQGARIVTEKYKCGSDSYVRYLVNDAVIPIKSCQSGPGFSCKLSDFSDYVANRLQNVNYATQCDIGQLPASVSFLWDYSTVKYNASDIDS